MKIAVVYTSTTPELIQMVEQELQAGMEGIPYQLLSYQNAGILQCAREHGGVTPQCARDLMLLYEQAAKDGADIILNACSSVGDIAKLAKPLYEIMGIDFVRIDEGMATEAVRCAGRIGVVATLSTTLEPTKRLVLDCAAELGKDVELTDVLADGAFGLDQDQFKQMLINKGKTVAGCVDALLFAQGSMAYAESDVSQALNMPVFSSIRFGVKDVCAAVRRRNGKS